MFFDHLHVVNITFCYEIYGDALSTPSTTATNSMQICIDTARNVEINHRTHLLDIDASRGDIGGDEHAVGTSAELVENMPAFIFGHVAMDTAYWETFFLHRIAQFIYTPDIVHINDRL